LKSISSHFDFSVWKYWQSCRLTWRFNGGVINVRVDGMSYFKALNCTTCVFASIFSFMQMWNYAQKIRATFFHGVRAPDFLKYFTLRKINIVTCDKKMIYVSHFASDHVQYIRSWNIYVIYHETYMCILYLGLKRYKSHRKIVNRNIFKNCLKNRLKRKMLFITCMNYLHVECDVSNFKFEIITIMCHKF